jgi:hypothetical protein
LIGLARIVRLTFRLLPLLQLSASLRFASIALASLHHSTRSRSFSRFASFAPLRFVSLNSLRAPTLRRGTVVTNSCCTHVHSQPLESTLLCPRRRFCIPRRRGTVCKLSVMRSSFNDLTFFELICDHLRLEMINRDFHVVVFMT